MPDTAEDRLGQSLKVGDVVDFVYGGEPHHMEIAAISQGAGSVLILTGIIEVSVPAPSAALTGEKRESLASKTLASLRYHERKHHKLDEQVDELTGPHKDQGDEAPDSKKPQSTGGAPGTTFKPEHTSDVAPSGPVAEPPASRNPQAEKDPTNTAPPAKKGLK